MLSNYTKLADIIALNKKSLRNIFVSQTFYLSSLDFCL